jgi:lysyl-tRNA synthetase class 2
MTSGRSDVLRLRHAVLKGIRRFFDSRRYVEVETPCLVPATVPEEHIDLFRTTCGLHLNASPEPQMKRLLAAGMERIYQLGRAYRAGERGPWHMPEFTILEWYRAGADYRDLMDETAELLVALCPVTWRELPVFSRMSVDEAFERWARWRPSAAFDPERFDRDLVERVEPALADRGAVFLHDYPAGAASFARLAPGDPAVAERFELYLDGVELANGFSELTDPDQQLARLEAANRARRASGRPAYGLDHRFVEALRAGLPPCAGIAVGVDRLVAVLLGYETVDDAVAFRREEL